ncbi:uncharacterized protein L3040_008359 [Drepanopeziza brunnea f. sp. 'multigermtubi']|uniref:Uncharacterized protein n=1 Tax=Marssonina brunnea f. sp. multigermtubi (strain MB_m1) TaxID=1072389 RepID=K1WN31_MARBU|nr:uncharacterized protein MBM_07521 [Drepanopeziza brunnea f. sp. 'multigermtubi' MB_m1]EKD14291.1 hypothetical protein MBM_07521 [Drepanopeziza brunnea f. sp. 'multigermtubi' MB_m1]KAJ5035098.1 hypothetical protein L3040_008359 [Drepanopeziza brunnea f. sp. 'multigermtubi']
MKTAVLLLFSILHTGQAAFGAYNLYLASISIRNLSGYEETIKKAAKHSNTVGEQLHRTRTTQASGTCAILASLLSSIYLLLVSENGRLVVVGLNALALASAWHHVGAFWTHKARIPLPGVGDYNAAMRNTQEVRANMAYLVASWVAVGALALLF